MSTPPGPEDELPELDPEADISTEADDLASDVTPPPNVNPDLTAGGLTRDEAEKLVTQWVGLAYKQARKLADAYNMEQEEADQCAILGLVKAANMYDPKRGQVFYSYAKACIINQLRRGSKMIRGEKLHRVDLDSPMGDDEGSGAATSHDVVSSEDTGAPDQPFGKGLDLGHFSGAIEKELAKLPPRDAQWLRRYLENNETYREIAADSGKSHTFVGQVIQKSLAILRQELSKYGVEGSKSLELESLRAMLEWLAPGPPVQEVGLSTLMCKDCGDEIREGEALNGYCEKCVDLFSRREDAERLEREQEREKRANNPLAKKFRRTFGEASAEKDYGLSPADLNLFNAGKLAYTCEECNRRVVPGTVCKKTGGKHTREIDDDHGKDTLAKESIDFLECDDVAKNKPGPWPSASRKKKYRYYHPDGSEIPASDAKTYVKAKRVEVKDKKNESLESRAESFLEERH
jgi:RNA polymerase sigma factor (sigma-70 family)